MILIIPRVVVDYTWCNNPHHCQWQRSIMEVVVISLAMQYNSTSLSNSTVDNLHNSSMKSGIDELWRPSFTNVTITESEEEVVPVNDRVAAFLVTVGIFLIVTLSIIIGYMCKRRSKKVKKQ